MSDTALPSSGAWSSTNETYGDGLDGGNAAKPGGGRAPGEPTSTTGAPAGAPRMNVGVDPTIDPLRALRDYLRTSSVSGGSGDDDNGAPALAPSHLSGNVEDMALAMHLMQASFSNAQAGTALAEIKNNSVKLKASQAEQNAHYKKAVESGREAEAKSGGVLGFFRKLFKATAALAGIVLSAIAVAATAGAAAPLLAFAVAGAIGATISLASEISQAAGGPPISLSAMLTKMGTALALACGASEEDAEKIGKVAGNSMGVLLAVIDPSILGELAGGIAALSGASPTVMGIITVVATLAAVALTMAGTNALLKGVEGGNKLVGVLAKMAGLKYGLMVTKGVAEGAGGIVGGTQGILVARSQFEVDTARADAKAASVQTMKLQKQMDDLLEEVRRLFERVEDSYSGATRMLGRASQSYQLLARNMGARMGA
ncbi:hypothetical protein WM40_00860 [Robbsia andropogonis]|uniref:Translocator protein BipB-like C-terminal domain-containing protein n=1 Tax=Robbsia andropogonis TaxID=28092 RepID=A0A0F5K5K9_9BURK|nr:type III secretion system translocon subunit SctE [Robbsia andropogonis]KKB65220.1 hypothetical protein WM40_00860 [Robbsia andropogonis]MCP1117117.1 type III secretion system translocon subunit SctE [Robbsia andropogonis]MCP1128463.1 type III secretion system translocon subunit SctE [Robbsia andropogonis]